MTLKEYIQTKITEKNIDIGSIKKEITYITASDDFDQATRNLLLKGRIENKRFIEGYIKSLEDLEKML